MKKRGLVWLMIVVALLVMTGIVGARDIASTNLSIKAEIVTPLQLSLLYGLDFGKVFKGDMGIVVDPINPAIGTTPAVFQVAGEPNTGFVVTLPTTASISNGKTTLDVKNFMSSLQDNAGMLNTNGVADFNVGAVLSTIPETAESGVYSGNAMVTVVYSF